jgi:hypothetical protein
MMAAVFRKEAAATEAGTDAALNRKSTSKNGGMPRNQSYTCVQEPFVVQKSSEKPEKNYVTQSLRNVEREETLGEKVKVSNVVGSILAKLCESQSVDALESASAQQAVFHGTILPKISLANYCFRILKYGRISSSVMVCGIVYIDSLVKNKVVKLSEFSVHRLLLAACVVSAKVVDDKHLSNKNFSLVGGVSLEELNHLEVTLCLLMDFKLNVPHSIYEKYVTTIEALL